MLPTKRLYLEAEDRDALQTQRWVDVVAYDENVWSLVPYTLDADLIREHADDCGVLPRLLGVHLDPESPSSMGLRVPVDDDGRLLVVADYRRTLQQLLAFTRFLRDEIPLRQIATLRDASDFIHPFGGCPRLSARIATAERLYRRRTRNPMRPEDDVDDVFKWSLCRRRECNEVGLGEFKRWSIAGRADAGGEYFFIRRRTRRMIVDDEDDAK